MLRRLKRLSLRQNFLLIGLLPLCLCCVAMMSGFLIIQHKQIKQAKEHFYTAFSNIFEHHQARQLAPGTLLDELAPTLLQWPNLHHLSVLTSDGSTLHSVGLPVPFQQLSWLDEESLVYFERDQKAYVVSPYVYKEQRLWLLAGFDLTNLKQPVYQILLWALGGFVGLSLLVATANTLLLGKVQTPIHRITQELDHILRHNSEKPLRNTYPAPFNRLLQKINGLINRQNRLNQDLQQHIANATHELQETLETVEIQNIELDIARKNALQNNRIKSEFLANTSHELRTPLNGILGFTSLLGKTDLDSDQQDYLETIEQSAQGLLSTINDILDFSKLETGEIVLENKVFDARALVEQIVRSNTNAAEEKNIRLSTEIAADISTRFVGDAKRIGQVLHKLISNAVKFSRSDDVIVNVSMLSHDTNERSSEVILRFAVEDHGIGLDKTEQAQLFAPFTQADSGDTRQHGGTGLGLAIAKSLVQRMRGEIGVESVPEKGAVFWFALPVAIADKRTSIQKASVDASLEEKYKAPEELAVLGVDDNEANLKLLAEFLRGLGIEPSLASNGKEAVALAHSQHFDLILMDVQMPDMNGMQAAQHIRSQETTRRTPIIALTAHIEPENRTQLLLAGMDDFMAKPITEDDLKSLLERWVFLGDTMHQPQNAGITIQTPTAPSQVDICQGRLSDEDKMFDLNETLRLTKDSADLAYEMFDMLMSSIATTKIEAQKLFDLRELEALRDVVHRFHGGCCYCGVPRLRKISRDLEKAIGSGVRTEVEPLLAIFVKEMEKLEDWVAEHDMKTLFGLDSAMPQG